MHAIRAHNLTLIKCRKIRADAGRESCHSTFYSSVTPYGFLLSKTLRLKLLDLGDLEIARQMYSCDEEVDVEKLAEISAKMSDGGQVYSEEEERNDTNASTRSEATRLYA